LYHTSLDDALRIISEVKNILGIQEKYFLEKEFIHFDCLGFDIKNGKISLKIYEILKKDVFLHHLPKYISPDIIKEV